MSKEEQARVRNELLQHLYKQTLRAQLAGAREKKQADAAPAVAAGVCVNLTSEDTHLVPRRAGAGWRALRASGTPESLPVRIAVTELPDEEAAAVALSLGSAIAAARTETVVCAVLPGKVYLEAGAPRSRARREPFPATWTAAGEYAAEHRLPLLFVSDALRGSRRARPSAPAFELPAPRYPSIPVDRDDSLAIYRVAYECSSRARAGGGPSHIDCLPFAVRGAAEPSPDALHRIETMLRKRGAFHKAWKREVERELIREAAER